MLQLRKILKGAATLTLALILSFPSQVAYAETLPKMGVRQKILEIIRTLREEMNICFPRRGHVHPGYYHVRTEYLYLTILVSPELEATGLWAKAMRKVSLVFHEIEALRNRINPYGPEWPFSGLDQEDECRKRFRKIRAQYLEIENELHELIPIAEQEEEEYRRSHPKGDEELDDWLYRLKGNDGVLRPWVVQPIFQPSDISRYALQEPDCLRRGIPWELQPAFTKGVILGCGVLLGSAALLAESPKVALGALGLLLLPAFSLTSTEEQK